MNDLSVRLPAELSARRQQYEYYRDRLLTFDGSRRMTEPTGAPRYEPIAVSDESTVVAEFLPEPSKGSAYQSEAALEAALIELLQGQAYEYLPISSASALEANLRAQLEALNKIEFSDAEWQRFFTEKIASANDGIVEKTARIQEDHVQVLKRDDGTIKNVYLIDKVNVHNNRLQVINQYEVPSASGAHANRYDVTVLVNGLPLVHVELKRRGVDIREAFNQINRYQRDSFWADSGLFEYVQLFVISNGTLTKYYSNTTRDRHIGELASGNRSRKQTSNSFEFTSWWADATNKPITDLVGFTRTFFAKHTLLNVLTKYCVFDVDRKLLVMRPYQIVAAERILQRIQTSTTYKQTGTTAAGGYIWHTTGSGKTLTSFKAAQLASRLPGLDKVLFVVDRKDLDYQTMREYERFETGAANSNASTRVLARQLADPSARIIITTIQKLVRFIGQSRGHEVFGDHVVIIFDECHRSQFGDMHLAVTRSFKRLPPVRLHRDTDFRRQRRQQRQSAAAYNRAGLRREAAHVHDRRRDQRQERPAVPHRLRQHGQAARAPRGQAGLGDRHREGAARPGAPEARSSTTSSTTSIRRRSGRLAYRHGDKRLSGFNSLFATASIDAAKRYYSIIEMAQRDREERDPATSG